MRTPSLSFRSIVVLAAIAAAPACVAGPNYKRPPVVTPGEFRGGAPTPDPVSIGDQTWTTVFDDEVLRQLIDTALKQNYDLRIAASRIEQASAQYGIAHADRYPTVNGQASAQGAQGSIIDGERLPLSGLVQLGGALSWELDFWGKFRRAS